MSSSISKSNYLFRLFKKLDQNGDGLVSPDELQSLLDAMKLSSSVDELQCLTENTSLGFFEFLCFYDTVTKKDFQENEHEEKESDLFKAFEVFDTNQDGFICDEELRAALSSFGLWDDKEDDVKSMIKAYDSNSDGFLDFKEFKKMMA